MATETRTPKKARDPGRVVYRLTVDQVLRMTEAGILPEHGHLELWDGVLYKMTRNEPHTFTVIRIAEVLRPLIPDAYHVREEKPLQHGDYSLPEPDVAVVRGALRSYQTRRPNLSDAALVVEVCDTTEHADRKVKPPRFAQVGIPVYWLVDINRRRIEVYTLPEGSGKEARYMETGIYGTGQTAPVVIDGREVGRVAVADVLPEEEPHGHSQP
jgi:Uma2 family endonuclease